MFRHRCPALIRWRGPKDNGIIRGPTLVVHDRSRAYSSRATKTGDGSSVPLHHHHHNDTEVQKFSNMSQQWWDIKYNPLIAMNPIRIQFIQQCIQQYLVRHDDDNNNSHDGGEERNIDTSSSSSSALSRQGTSPLKVLDIGCGGGLLCESLVRLGGTAVVGLDPSTSLIQVAQHHAASTLNPLQLSNLQYFNTTVQDYYYYDSTRRNSIHQSSEKSRSATTLTPLNERFTRDDGHKHHDQQFDIICCLEVLEHVSNEQRRDMLQVACQHLLRPGGLLLVSTINRTLQSYLITIIGAEYIAQLLPPRTHNWHQYLSPLMIRDELQSLSTTTTTTTTCMKMVERSVRGMVLPVTSLPATILFHQWDWRLDPNDTNVNWIGCYQKEEENVGQ